MSLVLRTFLVTLPIAIAVTASTAAAGTAALRCQATKDIEAGKYALCRQKAEGKFALTGDAPARTNALDACVAKYAAKWTRAEERADAAGDPCPTTGDQDRIRDAIDALFTSAAIGLAGQRFVDNDDGTVTDTETRLVWELKTGTVGSRATCGDVSACPDPHAVNNVYTWSTSGTQPTGTIYSNFLGRLNGAYDGTCFTGHCDWRLPTQAELQTLLPPGGACFRFLCLVDPLFGATAYRYWSNETNPSSVPYALSVDFVSDFGDFIQSPKTDANYARAVRVVP